MLGPAMNMKNVRDLVWEVMVGKLGPYTCEIALATKPLGLGDGTGHQA